MNKSSSIILFVIVCGLFSGCTSTQLHFSLRESAEDECRHIIDYVEQKQCLSQVDKSYKENKQEQKSANK